MNSSFDSTNFKSFPMNKELIIENDINTINSNTSFLTSAQFSTNKLLFKNNLLDSKKGGSFYTVNNDIKDTSSVGLIMFQKEENSKLYNKIINLNKEKYKDSWIEITSQSISKIILIKIIDQCYFEGHLYLKNNLNSEYISGKFINNKNYYTITPSFFFIKPEGEIIINIKRFCKLAPDEPSSNANDKILMFLAKTKNVIEDLNDAKVYLRKDDIFSPDYQLFSFSLILDNGHNPIYYNKLIEERKKKMELFYDKININEVKTPNVIRAYIEELKKNIDDYKLKILIKEKQLEDFLEKNEKKEIINKDNIKTESNKKILINEEVFYEVKEKKGILKSKDNENNNPKDLYYKIKDIAHDEDGITIPMLLFGLSISLFIGKFIKYLVFS
jgi:hypothetical protein